jgi:hypothetical protein
MLIVMVIAAIIVIKLVKPAFQQASVSAAGSLEEAKYAARSISLLFLIPRFWKRV